MTDEPEWPRRRRVSFSPRRPAAYVAAVSAIVGGYALLRADQHPAALVLDVPVSLAAALVWWQARPGPIAAAALPVLLDAAYWGVLLLKALLVRPRGVVECLQDWLAWPLALHGLASTAWLYAAMLAGRSSADDRADPTEVTACTTSPSSAPARPVRRWPG